MPGFNAGKAVPKLDWDFTDYVDGAKGNVPEPSQARLDAFRHRVAAIDVDTDLSDLDAVAARMKVIETQDEVLQEFIDAVAELCQECPSADQLRALPPRVREAFLGWLFGLVLDPTGMTAAMRR